MRKNVAGQVVTVVLINKSDGTPVTTGTTSVYVTIDGGTQASGGGTVVHEGNGAWSYVPTQAETNGDSISFLFTNSNAVSANLQVFTIGYNPQAPGWSTHSAADVWSVATRILTAGTNIALAKGTGVTGFNDLDAAGVRLAVGLTTGNLDTQLSMINGFLDTEIATLLTQTGASAIRTAVGLATDNLDTQLGTLATAASLTTVSGNVTAIKSKTDSLTFTVANQVRADIRYVNGVQVDGAGTSGDPWGPV